MGVTIPGGFFIGRNGKPHDANGAEVPLDKWPMDYLNTLVEQGSEDAAVLGEVKRRTDAIKAAQAEAKKAEAEAKKAEAAAAKAAKEAEEAAKKEAEEAAKGGKK